MNDQGMAHPPRGKSAELLYQFKQAMFVVTWPEFADTSEQITEHFSKGIRRGLVNPSSLLSPSFVSMLPLVDGMLG